MKVLMVTDVFPNRENPNFGTFSIERLKSLRKLAEVQVVAAVPFFPDWPALKRFKKWHAYSRVPKKETAEGTDIHHPRRVVIPKIGGFTNGLFYYNTLKEAFDEVYAGFHFDVIDAHFVWPDGYAAVKAGKNLNVPVCVTAHGTDLNLMPKFPTIRPLIVSTLKNADRIIAVSEALAEIAKELGAPTERLKVIHNGVDTAKFRRIEKQAARKEIGADRDAILLVSIGALIPRKGHENLIDAMHILVKEGERRLKLLIIGEGEERKALEERIGRNHLEAYVSLAGSVPHGELYKYLSAADFFCLTSSREGWPTVFFEAWACGVPVLATAVHGAPEAICSDAYGLLIERQDPNLVAATIKKALTMTWDPKAMMDYAAENTWDRLAREIFAELEDVVAKHGGP